ncbi:glycosyltransferase family 4 protein [Porticoccaceae bacterium]|nr:glycosyltransferase family 4 protein [Porticoccaceae bacterium]
MNIIIHDYAGHPFQVELSRNLASRGHHVTHIYFAGDRGPKGNMKLLMTDSDTLSIEAVGSQDYSKTNFMLRRRGDIRYGKLVADRIREISPDIVFSGNTPTETQEFILGACIRENCKFVYWCQDFYSIAARTLLKKKLGVLGAAIGSYYTYLERRQMRSSDHVVLITDKFSTQTKEWGIDQKKVSVIPNWGAINEIDMLPKSSVWASQQDLDEGRLRALYSGTLGLKHNPELLRLLAQEIGELETIVVASGVGVDELREHKKMPENLKLLPLQPFSKFSEVLASADVLLAIIEKDAGNFSVPSKILSYLCAGRAIVLAAPRGNLAAEIIRSTGSGIVVDSNDSVGFVKAVRQILEDKDLRKSMGKAGRKYAEENFGIDLVTDKFERIVDK